MPARVAPVTAVLVAHDGSRWLPEVLAALDAQTVRPRRVVAVDTGSVDDSAALLRRALGDVLELPRSTSYAAAITTALASVPADTRWIWLLHDDAAPTPDALEMLLRHGATAGSAAVLGPKAVAWDDPQVLLELGLSVDGGGHRVAQVEPGELDQGQHDAPRDVLAVGTAGALVRREVWDDVGGLDPALAPFADDLDLGWRVSSAGQRVVVVPAAVVRHVGAAARAPAGDPAPTRAAERRGALDVLLRHTAGWRLALLLPRLVLSVLLRALALLARRAPGEARGELAALAAALSRPDRLLAARRARAATRRLPAGALRTLRPAPGARLRARGAALLEGATASAQGLRPRSRAALVLGLALLVVALLAERALLGGGALAGGRLLPAPDSAGDLWSLYARSPEAPPYLAVLAGAAVLLLGQVGLLVDLLLLGAVPLSGLVAYAATRAVTEAVALRVWAAATWALLPVATGAVAAGRLDVVLVHLTLPALLAAGARLLARDPRRAGGAGAVRLGLGLGLVGCFAPVLWPLAALLLLGGAAVVAAFADPGSRRRRLATAGVATGIPLVLLLPWVPTLVDRPAALLHGPGRLGADLAEPALPFAQLLLLNPGGPGVPALAATAGLLLAALGGLLPARRARTAAAGWALALVGLAAALAVSRVRAGGVPVWPGVPLDLAAAGLLLAALVAADGLRDQLRRSAFGWRQLTAVLVLAAAAAVPALTAAQWVLRGADEPLRREAPVRLPAFARAELTAAAQQRALLLTERSDGVVGYALTGAEGLRLGFAETSAPDPRLDADVGDLLAPRGAAAASALAARRVLFVALTGDPAGRTAEALDAQPGLAREPSAPALWRVLPAAAAPGRPAEARTSTLALQGALLLAVVVLAAPARRRPAQVRP